MTVKQNYHSIDVSQILTTAQKEKDEGRRCIQICCTTTDDGIDVMYSYRDFNGFSGVENFVVHGLSKGDEIPSIQEFFPSQFPFENEAHDLFGINVTNMKLDFEGNFYKLGEDAPMTVISTEQLKRKERAKKIAAAMKAKQQKQNAQQSPVAKKETSSPTQQSPGTNNKSSSEKKGE